ncbi:endonuclease/exonuclease/phosphatase family protein [Nocardioides xinjiangensis]|uniref:endonuclease/exonuclease/phosphatase family protein n=1 Tax=Nocardioides xinjiangensis TaxID=2817376 RepID=UPI001B3173DD|nr:endonuclease/exonuclease/phosphatase family protein [Nocardioides sp. SYSU D00514]
MRIGTWNLDGRWSDDHEALLAEQDCDVWLLTEVNESTSLAGFAVHRSQSLAAPRRRWAAVASRLPMTSAPDPHPASAQAQVGATTYVSSVLPWRSARSGPVWVGDRHAEKTLNAVDDLLLRLRPCRSLVWGGDWNHALTGREHAGSAGGRAAISRAVAELGLTVPTAELPHALDGLLSIDHVALPAGTAATARRVVAEHDGRRLSDHDAYVVDTDS